MTQIPTTCGHAVLQVLAFAGWMTAKAIADAHNAGTREGVGPMQVYQLYSWKQVRAAISGMGEACARVDRHWVDRKRRTDGGTGYLYRITDAGLSKLRELQLEAARNRLPPGRAREVFDDVLAANEAYGDRDRVTVDYECISVDGRPAGVIVGFDFAIDMDMDIHHADAIPYHWVTSPSRASRLAHRFFDPTRPPIHGMFNCRGDYVMPKPPMSLFDAVAIARKVLHSAPWPALPDGVSSDDAKRAYDALALHHSTMPHVVAMDRSDPRYYDSPWPKFQEKPVDLIEFQWGFPTATQIVTERRDRGHRVAPTSSRQRLRDTVLAACKEVFGLSGVEAESLRGLRVRATPEQYGRFVALVAGSAVALNTRPTIVEPEVPKQEPVDLTGKGPLTRVTWVP